MNYYSEIKDILVKNEIYSQIKDYSKDINKVKAYFETGKLLHMAGKAYGKNIIRQYSEKLIIEVGKKYNERNLRYMRQFYEMIKKTKWNAMCSKLCWSHYRELLVLKDIDEILYYLIETENKNLSQRQLHEYIKTNAYNRLSKDVRKKLLVSKDLELCDIVPNPIIIKSNNIMDSNYNEYVLKRMILDNLDNFLFQLGECFTYAGNEYKIKIGDKYNYIDLLLFNYKYNSFEVIELKVTELKKEYIGQIEVYMNYIDNNVKNINHNRTIGIIICKKDNQYVIEYCSDKRIISRTYKIINKI